MEHLNNIMHMLKNDKRWKDQCVTWDQKRYDSAYNTKQVLGLLSVLTLYCGIMSLIFPLTWGVKLLVLYLGGYSALVLFTLYKEYDLRSSIISYNRFNAELLDSCTKLADERGARLQIKPRIIMDDHILLLARDCVLELKADLIEAGECKPFFTARLPLWSYLDSTFSVAYPSRYKIDVWLHEKTLSQLNCSASKLSSATNEESTRRLVSDALKTGQTLRIRTKWQSEFDCRVLKQISFSFKVFCSQNSKSRWFDFSEVEYADVSDVEISIPPGVAVKVGY